VADEKTQTPIQQTITALVPATFSEAQTMAQYLCKSALLPPDLRGKEHDVLVTMATGAELGLSPMASFRGIYVVKGRPFLASDLMVALVRRSGLCEYFRPAQPPTDQAAVWVTKRRGEEPVTLSFTIEQAKKAGYLEGRADSPWHTRPRRMLANRCTSELCKVVYPDVLFGVGLVDDLRPEEIAGRERPDAGEVWQAPPGTIDVEAKEVPASSPPLAAAKPKASAKKAAKPEPEPEPGPEPGPDDGDESEQPPPAETPEPTPASARAAAAEVLAAIAKAASRPDLDALVTRAQAMPEPEKGEVIEAWKDRNRVLWAEQKAAAAKGGGK